MTPKAQRIGIIVIAIVMIAGTLGSFYMLILANDNALRENEELAREQQALMEQQQEEMERQQVEARELSDVYLPVFEQYEDRPEAFDADEVGDEVTHVDLKEGDGEVIDEDFNNYRAYYMGWNPRGVVFDGSLDGDQLKPPLDLNQMTLIEGWYQGVEGMKIGGVREITIPSDLAYGEAGQGEDIPPNTPIKFIVMPIPASE